MTDEFTRHKPSIVRANGIDIAFESFGDPTDPALLLIMGLGTQMVVWDEDFCRQLAARGYRVIRFDNRDVGLSTHFGHLGVPDLSAIGTGTFSLPYTLADMAADAVGLLDALDIGSAHVAGVSMGGMIAQIMAARHPDRLRTLTSIMSSTGNPALPPPEPEALEILMTPFPPDRDGYIDMFVRSYRVLSGPEYPVNDALSRKWAEQSFARGLDPGGIARQMAAIVMAGDRTEMLGTIRVPTLVIHGSADPILPVANGNATADAIPGAGITIIDGMGHTLPEAIWPQIIEAIAGHAR